MSEEPTIEVAVQVRCELGEGPVWRHERQELLWVDIAQGLLYSWSPAHGDAQTTRFAGETSAIVPCADGGLVLALGHDLLRLGDEGRATETLASVESGLPGNRFNDCRCDPQGRLWAGTMSTSREPGAAGLYRLVAGRGIELVLPATTLSNGIGWSPDGQTMYFIDSTTQRIDAFDFDGGQGTVANRRCLAEIAPGDGMPDGMAVDADGGVWVCLFGGGAVRRYGPDGALDEHVSLPVPHPTCPAFGGPDLSTIYVTTTRHRLTPEQLGRLPDAGLILALRPGVKGLPANEFGLASAASGA